MPAAINQALQVCVREEWVGHMHNEEEMQARFHGLRMCNRASPNCMRLPASQKNSTTAAYTPKFTTKFTAWLCRHLKPIKRCISLQNIQRTHSMHDQPTSSTELWHRQKQAVQCCEWGVKSVMPSKLREGMGSPG